MGINRKLVPLKGHFFLFSCAVAPIYPFLSVMLRDLGFSAMVIGTIFTLVPLIAFLFKPLLGGIADKYHCHKLIFMGIIIVQLFSFLATNWLPSLPTVTSEIACDDFTLKICSDQLTTSQITLTPKFQCSAQLQDIYNIELNGSLWYQKNDCLHFPITQMVSNLTKIEHCNGTMILEGTNCENKDLNVLISSPSVSDDDILNYHQFWIALLVITIAQTCRCSLLSITDTVCFNLLGDNPGNFGLTRIGASLGWGLMAFVSGLVVDKMSEGSVTKDFTSSYVFLVVFSILDLIVSFQVDFKVTTEPAKSIIKDVFRAMNNRHVLVFMFWCLINGIYNALIWNFLFWFLEDVAANNGYEDMTYIKTLEGLALAFHTFLGELPFFIISSWMIRKIGHVNLMSFVLVIMGVRFVYYSYLTNPWWTLPVETFNGVTFAVFYSTMSTYACTFSPPGTETTIQTFVAALFDALGSSMGSFIGGYMLQRIGGVLTFWYLGLSSFAFAVLFRLAFLVMGKPSFGPNSNLPEILDKKDLESDAKVMEKC